MAQIHQIARKPDPDVVVFLEHALERAKSGDTTGVLLLEQDPTGVHYTLAHDRFTVLGWLSHAMHRLQDDPE